MSAPKDHLSTHNAGLLRRLASAVYDSMLVIALFVIPTSLSMAVLGGEAIPAGSIPFQIVLIITAGAFFVGFWTRGGQTLGMRAWRIKVMARDGTALTFGQALLRFCACLPAVGLLGAGIWWLIFDRSRQTIPDRLAGTRVVYLPKDKR